MSSPQSTTQYVYIPNLVGRQMLRIPVFPCDDEVLDTVSDSSLTPNDVTITAQAPLKRTDSAYSRDSSPSPSIGSVSEEE